jgi:hypothetical protein
MTQVQDEIGRALAASDAVAVIMLGLSAVVRCCGIAAW